MACPFLTLIKTAKSKKMFYNPVNQSRVHIWHAVCRVCHTSKVIKLIPFSTLRYLSHKQVWEGTGESFPNAPQSTREKAGLYVAQNRKRLGCSFGSKKKKEIIKKTTVMTGKLNAQRVISVELEQADRTLRPSLSLAVRV